MIGRGGEGSPSILVVIAALNEEEGIGPTIDELKDFLDESFCLVVDGHSIDGTAKNAEVRGARVIAQNGRGKGDAIATAIAHLESCKLGGDYVVLVDADFTYPAEYLPMMIEILQKNPDVGMVCGNRFGEQDLPLRNMRDIFYIGNRFLAFTHNLFNGVGLRDPLTGLRVLRWDVLKDWMPRSKGFDIEVELNHYVERKGYRITEVPIRYRERVGEKKLKLRHGLTILKRILAESMPPTPYARLSNRQKP
jgi:dolichol-phosphate mannosyltransferase